MAKMPADSFHLIVTDPPYNTLGMDLVSGDNKWDAYHLPLGFATKEKRESLGQTPKAMPFSRDQSDDLLAGLLPVAKEMLRVLKPGALALVMAAPRTSFASAMAMHQAGFEVRDLMTWHHNGGQPKAQELNRFNKAVPMNWKTPQPRQQFECVWLCRKPSLDTMTSAFIKTGVGLMNCEGGMPGQLFEVSKPSSSERASRGGHPTTKPVALFKRMLDLFAAPGFRILDPFAGSGTLAEAAGLEQEVVLIEQDTVYAERLKEKHK